VHGPVPVTARDGIGLLVGGDDGPPAFGCPWNPEYYPGLVESAGFSPTVALRSYQWIPGSLDHAHLDRMARRTESSRRVRLRPLDRRQLRAETRTITALINETLADAWHFEPVTVAEADALAGQLGDVVDPAMVLLAEDAEGTCAVALAVPDLNWLWHRAGNRLWPWGWWSLLTARHRVPHLRVLALGVAARHRGSNVVARLLHSWIETARVRGYQTAELAQVFDSNRAMCDLLDRRGLRVSRRYAVYSRSLSG
jgi:ribosomal protein S18 acetylase RimI-like enzyme